jgi:hypothetical protein
VVLLLLFRRPARRNTAGPRSNSSGSGTSDAAAAPPPPPYCKRFKRNGGTSLFLTLVGLFIYSFCNRRGRKSSIKVLLKRSPRPHRVQFDAHHQCVYVEYINT